MNWAPPLRQAGSAVSDLYDATVFRILRVDGSLHVLQAAPTGLDRLRRGPENAPACKSSRGARTSMRPSFAFLITATLASASGCKQSPPMVYVLEAPQEVTLSASVSATQVKVGDMVTLHAERRAKGTWKQIPRDELTPGQCWLYRPPPELEAEVADSVEWEIIPDRGMRLDPTFRMDHTRQAQMAVAGTYKLTPYSPVTCEKDRVIEGPTIEIVVS
jgi:hypothetical protein